MRTQGFSLFEVLISLLLLTSISLVMLKQQWQSTLYFNEIIQSFIEMAKTENAEEM